MSVKTSKQYYAFKKLSQIYICIKKNKLSLYYTKNSNFVLCSSAKKK